MLRSVLTDAGACVCCQSFQAWTADSGVTAIAADVKTLQQLTGSSSVHTQHVHEMWVASATGIDVEQGAGARRLAQFVLPLTHQAWAVDGTSLANAANDNGIQMADSVVYTVNGVTYPAGTYHPLDETTLPGHFTTEQQRIQFHAEDDSSAAAPSPGVATTVSSAMKQAQSALSSGLNKVRCYVWGHCGRLLHA